MVRISYVLSTLLLLLVTSGCTKVVHLSSYKFPPREESAEVLRIDARHMDRQALDQVLREYEILARYHVMVTEGERYEEDVAKKVELEQSMARGIGGHALLYTHDSQLIAAIMQDARYAGPNDRLVMYVLRRKEP